MVNIQQKVSIRVLDKSREHDLLRVTQLLALAESVPPTPELVKSRWDRFDPGAVVRRVVAVDEHERVIGYANAVCPLLDARKMFWINDLVDLEHRKQGVGSMLYDDCVAFAEKNGAMSFETAVRVEDLDSANFARKRGFDVEIPLFESELDLTTFDESAHRVNRYEDISISSVSELGVDEATLRAVCDVYKLTDQDTPNDSSDPVHSFDDFDRIFVQAENFDPRLWFIAKQGQEMVGLSVLQEMAPGQLSTLMTGVTREHRGKGLAMALKVACISRAKALGYKKVLTNNHAVNAPMLRVNEKLGFQSLPGWIIMRKFLQTETTSEGDGS